MAMTAWSAKVLTSSICLSVKGLTSVARQRQHADGNALAQHWHAEHGAITAALLASRARVFRIVLHIRDMNDLAFERSRPVRVPRPGSIGTLASCIP